VSSDRTPPLAFVSSVGDPRTEPPAAAGHHFVLAAVLVTEAQAATVRDGAAKLGLADPLARSEGGLRASLVAAAALPFRVYAVVIDKREMHAGTGLAHTSSATGVVSSLVHRKLFEAFPDLHVVSHERARAPFMEAFSQFVAEHHQSTLFDRPRVTFATPEAEPLVALADVVSRALSRAYEDTKHADLMALVRERAVLIDEWPVRYRAASGTGSLTDGDPSDDDLARYGIARAEEFLAKNETHADEGIRAQVVILKKLLYELRFGDPHGYVSSQALRDTLDAVGAPSGEQWLRSNVIAQLRDAGVLVASSPQGYKIPVAVADVSAFVAVTDTVVHPMLNRVARAREAVLLVTGGRVDVLAGDKLGLLRTAVDAIRGETTKPR